MKHSNTMYSHKILSTHGHIWDHVKLQQKQSITDGFPHDSLNKYVMILSLQWQYMKCLKKQDEACIFTD